MKIPMYAIEEFLIRLQGYNTSIGELKAYERLGSQIVVKTNNGIITVPAVVLNLQLVDPASLKQADIEVLAKRFVKRSKEYSECTIVLLDK